MSVNHCFEDLSQSLRVLLEADARANRFGLLQIDRAEAIGNIEIAYMAVLNAFHSLHDAIADTEFSKMLEWSNTVEYATVLVLRNARHHNHANKIRTHYAYHLQTSDDPTRLRQYVFVDFPAQEDGGDTFNLFLSASDLKLLLNLPRETTRIRDNVKQSIYEYLGLANFGNFAAEYELDESRVLFNVIPLLVNAMIKIVAVLRNVLEPNTTESETFLWLFEDMPLADTTSPEIVCGPFVLPSA